MLPPDRYQMFLSTFRPNDCNSHEIERLLCIPHVTVQIEFLSEFLVQKLTIARKTEWTRVNEQNLIIFAKEIVGVKTPPETTTCNSVTLLSAGVLEIAW